MMSLGCGLDTKKSDAAEKNLKNWKNLSPTLTDFLPPPRALKSGRDDVAVLASVRQSVVPQGGDNHLHYYLSMFMFNM